MRRGSDYVSTSLIELIEIFATILVLISFTQSDVKRIRYINILGCILFVIYGLLIHAFSVWVLNGVCIGLHIFKLYKNLKVEGDPDAKHNNK